MGLQNWLPSQAALSSMACLDVETPSLCRGKFKSVLQLCLQQRRTREQLVEQGIMPPLKTPAGFHEQIRSLERAKTGTFLKHKLCSRPERSELIRMHILQGSDAQAEASVNASRMNLKRARLADDLNEKISRQPGPRELMEKKILPADSDVEGVLNGERVNSFKAQDVYSFDEDNSDTLSPEEKSSKQETPRSSSSSSLRESEETRVTSSSLQLNSQHSPPSSDKTHSSADLAKFISTNDQQGNTQASAPQPKATVGPSVSPGPVLVKQTLPKLPGDKGRSKKSKEPKPWMKKLKYHQYIPPDQKQEVIEMPMDSAYARLLQQQQQFLQLQILSQQQQQQQHNYTGSLPSTINRTETEVQTSCSGGNAASAQYVHGNHKLYHLPANLDEMKVSELKVELKRRSLPVSGTKTDLIDRLRQYAETSNIQTNTAVEMPASQLTPPVSPIATKVSSLGLEDSSMADTRAVSSQKAPQEEFYPEKSYWKDSTHLSEKDCEKDKRLYEKERQIEELMRKLEQEQRLVEELKMKLKVEKRNQQINTSPRLSPLPPAQIKKETCPTSCSSPALPMLVKQEEAADLGHMSPPDQFIINNQTIKQPETLLSVQAGPQILLPASLPTSAFAIQLPANCIKLNNAVSSAPPGLAQTSGQHPQKTKTPAASQQQSSAHTPPPVENQRMNSAAQNLLGTFPGSSCSTGHASKSPSHGQPVLNVHQPSFTNHVSSCKDPPRYEDAVKQTRSMLTAVQSPSAASQQMDDLFDVLMESGEISPFIKQDPPTVGQPIPVTANVTILPVSTVLSRPPPMVHVAHAPAEVAKSSNCCATLSPDPQLDTLFSSAADQHTLKLIDALRSPMEADFNQGSPPSALTLHMNNMENMDWLDLTLAVPAEGIHSLDMSTSVGVFSPDFVDSPELF